MRFGPWSCALSVLVVLGGTSAWAQDAAIDQPADPVAVPANTLVEQSPVTVEVYDVADLIVPSHPAGGISTTTPEEWSIGPREQIATSLERLTQVLSLALDDADAEHASSRQSIVAYPEKMSLIVRQDAAGHRAIEDLLTQLRGGTEIEILIEMLNAEGVPEEMSGAIAKAMQQPLTAEEAAEFRLAIPVLVSSETRVDNGGTSVVSGYFAHFMRITAATDATREDVRVWLDVLDVDSQEAATLLPYRTYAQLIPLGMTTVVVASVDEENLLLLVTPTIRERPVRTAAAPE